MTCAPAPAGYAACAADARRHHPEPPHPYRNAFQRDRDRVLHSSAFRRLDYKTQVFVPHEHDHFRTRLTHSLEVAQVARDAGRALALQEDLIEAVALAHDLGHPPFGHGGEAALYALMADRGHFEHNRQSLRIVDYLEHPYPDFRGLNLTDLTRECLAKHETRYDAPVCEDFDPSTRAPAEGQLVDLADAIAYTAADLEDALGTGWLVESDLAGLGLWEQSVERVRRAYPDARPIHVRIRATKGILAVLVDDLVAESRRRIEHWGLNHLQDVREAPDKCIGLSEAMKAKFSGMQEFLLERVYRHPATVENDQAGRTILCELFGAYLDDPSRLPERYQRRVDQEGLHRVICDYIAGMTDRYCRQEHRRVCG